MALRITSASDVQVIAAHFGVTLEEAKVLLRAYRVDELLSGVPVKTTGASAAPTQTSFVGTSLSELAVALGMMEDQLSMGGKAEISLCTDKLPEEEELADWYLTMVDGGFHCDYPTASVVDGVPTTTVTLKKGSPALVALIPILPTLFIVGLVAFGITQLGNISSALLPILITVVVGAVAVAIILAKPAQKVATAYLTPGSQQMLPGTSVGGTSS